jgi:hypothetical protein
MLERRFICPVEDLVWSVTSLDHESYRLEGQKGVFMVAASRPICPRCAGELVDLSEIDHWLACAGGLEGQSEGTA